ncbi:MAG: HepT-like ribonuclease domain-containing protein [Cyanobacteria bacterium P01_F01_bin.153]
MKNSRIYIIHIRDCIDRIETYTAEGKTAFFNDLKTQDAVLRNLETLADATQQLPETWTATEPDTDWIVIINFRNLLAHQYLDVNLNVVWAIIANDLPDLKIAIENIAERFWN